MSRRQVSAHAVVLLRRNGWSTKNPGSSDRLGAGRPGSEGRLPVSGRTGDSIACWMVIPHTFQEFSQEIRGAAGATGPLNGRLAARALHGARRRLIALQQVVAHHPVGAEAPGEGGDAVLHHLHPAEGDALRVAVEVEGQDRSSRSWKRASRSWASCSSGLPWCAVGADGEAVGAVVGLGPPAVQDRAVEPAVDTAFMPLVPLASSGRRGVLSQTSTPWTMWRPTLMS